jgi:trk system potassium uptake protein
VSEPEQPGAARHWYVRRVSPARAVVLAFLAAIALGTLMLRLPLAHAAGASHGWLTALFTATSAVCVTGLVVVDTGAAWSPFGQAVVASLIKAGGLGILSLGALVALATGRRLGFSERQRLQAQTNALTVGGIVRFVRALLLYTTGAELIGALALWPRFARDDGLWGGAWSALFHALSAFNNAGFSLYADSLQRYAADAWVAGVVMALFVVGGLGLVVVVDVALRLGAAANGGPRRHLTLHTRLALTTTLVLAVLGSILVGALEWRNPATLGALAPEARPLAATFQALTPRTAGFDALDIADYRTSTVFVTMGLMLVGGNPGSTAGGIKTTTIAVLLLAVLAAARGRPRVTAFRRTLDTETITKAAVLGMLAVATVGFGATVLVHMEPTLAPLALVFEAVSAFATVGLSLGITSELTEAGRVALVVLMFVGRVGLLTVALAVAATERVPSSRYPNEDVVVG